MRLALVLGVNESEVRHIRRGSLLHDIGRIGVPEQLLARLDRLTEDEQKIFEKHTQIAYDSLAGIDFLAPALDIPYLNHENRDGSGYPRGLKGKEIPLAARIFAVVDIWDVLSTDRQYRKQWPREKIIEYIREQTGKNMPPKLWEHF
jgi:HD-GYP domain-containing protein (c-di-GMP phosphodiesterase class II)